MNGSNFSRISSEDALLNEKELRRILIDLTSRGDYLAAEVGEEARRRIQEDLGTLLRASRPLLVLKAEGGGGEKAITNVFQGMPRLGGQGTITGVPGIGSRRFGLWVVKPLGHLSVDEFAADLEHKILGNARGLAGYEAVLRVYRLEVQKGFPQEITATGRLDNENVLQCSRLLAYFDEEERAEDVEALARQVLIPSSRGTADQDEYRRSANQPRHEPRSLEDSKERIHSSSKARIR